MNHVINNPDDENRPPSAREDIPPAPPKPPEFTKPNISGLAEMIGKARKSPQDVAALVTTTKVHVAMPILKPLTKGKYWRVRTGSEWSYQENSFLMLPPDFDSDRKEFMLVSPVLEEFVKSKPQVRNLARIFGLAFVLDAHGGPAYWALNLSDTGAWGTSARAIVGELQQDWGMLCPEQGRYSCERPEDDLGDPVWPAGDPNTWLEKAFTGRVIESEDHPEIKKLLGKK